MLPSYNASHEELKGDQAHGQDDDQVGWTQRNDGQRDWNKETEKARCGEQHNFCSPVGNIEGVASFG